MIRARMGIHTEAAAAVSVHSIERRAQRDTNELGHTQNQPCAHTHTVWLLIVLVWAGIPLDSISLKTLTDLLCACVCVCVSWSIEQVWGVCLREKKATCHCSHRRFNFAPLTFSELFFSLV